MSVTAPQRVSTPEPPEPEAAHLQAGLQQQHPTMIALGGEIDVDAAMAAARPIED
jgi:amino acid permease